MMMVVIKTTNPSAITMEMMKILLVVYYRWSKRMKQSTRLFTFRNRLFIFDGTK